MTSWYDAFGNTIDTESNVYYGRRQGNYRATNNTLGSSGGNETTLSSSYFDSTQFKPTNGSSYYWRSGRTYKWIAVWAPTT